VLSLESFILSNFQKKFSGEKAWQIYKSEILKNPQDFGNLEVVTHSLFRFSCSFFRWVGPVVFWVLQTFIIKHKPFEKKIE
jgi:hypothetical protein